MSLLPFWARIYHFDDPWASSDAFINSLDEVCVCKKWLFYIAMDMIRQMFVKIKFASGVLANFAIGLLMVWKQCAWHSIHQPCLHIFHTITTPWLWCLYQEFRCVSCVTQAAEWDRTGCPGTARVYLTTHLTTRTESRLTRTWISTRGPGTRESLNIWRAFEVWIPPKIVHVHGPCSSFPCLLFPMLIL